MEMELEYHIFQYFDDGFTYMEIIEFPNTIIIQVFQH